MARLFGILDAQSADPALPSVARDFGARCIIAGSVRRAATCLRINAQPIDASTGSHIWADRFDRDLDDIFLVQDGSYFPPPVRRVDIPKANGGTRPLGIPTVADPVAQEVARRYLEPILEPVFHTDSYGYRPG